MLLDCFLLMFYIVLMCEKCVGWYMFSDFSFSMYVYKNYTFRSNISIYSPKGRLPGSRKPPHTVTGQFQLSLQTLMEALNTANPFFIRCIKSNANKVGIHDFVCSSLTMKGLFWIIFFCTKVKIYKVEKILFSREVHLCMKRKKNEI